MKTRIKPSNSQYAAFTNLFNRLRDGDDAHQVMGLFTTTKADAYKRIAKHGFDGLIWQVILNEECLWAEYGMEFFSITPDEFFADDETLLTQPIDLDTDVRHHFIFLVEELTCAEFKAERFGDHTYVRNNLYLIKDNHQTEIGPIGFGEWKATMTHIDKKVILEGIDRDFFLFQC